MTRYYSPLYYLTLYTKGTGKDWLIALMTYTALLALLVVLTFSFPFAVRLTQALGVPTGLGVVTGVMGVVVALGWVVIRQDVKRQEALETGVAPAFDGEGVLPSLLTQQELTQQDEDGVELAALLADPQRMGGDASNGEAVKGLGQDRA